jgi:hypothetical protein
MEVLFQLEAAPALAPLKVTVPLLPKLVPVMVTVVPTGPELGDRLCMPGVSIKGSAFEFTPPTVTTNEGPGPGETQFKPLGTVAVTESSLQLATVAAYPLNVTELLPWLAPKLLPEMVTDEPTGPDAGERLTMFGGPGAGAGWTVTAVVADRPATVAVMFAVPTVTPTASPIEPGVFPAVTIEGLEELHAADAVRFCTLPSRKVPLTVSC